MARTKKHRFQSKPPADPITAVRESSLTFRLNIGFFLRQLGIFLVMDLLLFLMAVGGMFLYAENRCAQVAELVAERGVPTADAVPWMEASDYTITPLEAGLDFAVKLNKPEFIGKDALVAAGTPQRVRVGLAVTGRGIVREHQDLFLNGEKIGHTTSGTHCPFLGKALAMGLIDAKYAAVGTALEADVRGRRVAVEIVPLPFYKRG